MLKAAAVQVTDEGGQKGTEAKEINLDCYEPLSIPASDSFNLNFAVEDLAERGSEVNGGKIVLLPSDISTQGFVDFTFHRLKEGATAPKFPETGMALDGGNEAQGFVKGAFASGKKVVIRLNVKKAGSRSVKRYDAGYIAYIHG